MSKLADLKEIMSLISADAPTQGAANVASHFVGKYAIIRSRNEGINAGEIVAADGTGVVLRNARRIWFHRPANKSESWYPANKSESWYEGVANHGISDDSKVSGTVSQKAIIEDYSITLCTDVARQSIESAVAHAQS